MDTKEFMVLVEEHERWLKSGRKEGKRAKIMDKSVRGAVLAGRCLAHCSFQNVDFSGASFCRVDFSYANMEGSVFSGARVNHSSLAMAELPKTDWRDSSLRGSLFTYSNLQSANFENAELYAANFQGACLAGANLRNAEINFLTIGLHPAPEGELVGWGKKDGRVVKLLIPRKAKRSWATTRKLRAEYAKVLYVEGDGQVVVMNKHSRTVYKAGEIVRCHMWNPDRWRECAGGIYFFLSREEAERYKRF